MAGVALVVGGLVGLRHVSRAFAEWHLGPEHRSLLVIETAAFGFTNAAVRYGPAAPARSS
jgi:hypothetical protein